VGRTAAVGLALPTIVTLIPQPALRTLSMRDQIGDFLNARGLTGKGVEVGTLFGAYATDILKTWKGELYCIDPWVNQPEDVYFDGANKHDMNSVFEQVKSNIGRHPRCHLLRMMSLNAVPKFEDGELVWVYLDGNHALPFIQADIAAWWPKVKIGGIFSGHDFFTRYDKDTNSDALTAVMDLVEIIGVRPHVTWCTSWWFIKTEEADQKFRAASQAGKLTRPVYTDNTALDLVVVLPVARFDWNLAMKWLKWVASLAIPETSGMDGREKFPLVVWSTPALTSEQFEQLGDAAEPLQIVPEICSGLEEIGYFGSPNQMFKGALEYCEKEFPGRAMLWAEADTVPMRQGWYGQILAEYRACGRPFMGDVQRAGDIPHLTGNAVYHPNWRKLAPSLAAMGQEECGFDSLCAHDILPRAHYAKTIQQIWRPPLPITEAWAQKNIKPETALFHQCKDGSLIDVLCLRANQPLIPLAPALCASTYEAQKRVLAQRNEVRPSLRIEHAPGDRMEILIVTHQRDTEFLRYCLRSISMFTAGFHGVTLVVPNSEKHLFDWAKKGVKFHFFDEIPDKGHLGHLIQKCRADEICPEADYILHLDADCMFWRQCTPADFMQNGKPILVRERYADCGKRNENRLFWQGAVERALGFTPEWEGMTKHPNAHRRETYRRLREMVETHTGQSFDDYVLSGQNAFPQHFAEFPALAAIAIRDFPDKYHFVDYDREEDGRMCGIDPNTSWQAIYRYDRDFLCEFWTHSGIKRYEKIAEAIMQGKAPAFHVK